MAYNVILLIISLTYPTSPVRALTPGAVRPLSLHTVCTTKWGLDRRLVTMAMKRAVAAKYGVPLKKWSLYEFDHVIPRSLAGQDSEMNLWPQLWAIPYGAHQKDLLENELHRRVCRGEMTLVFAQTAINTNWQAAYRLYVRKKK